VRQFLKQHPEMAQEIERQVRDKLLPKSREAVDHDSDSEAESAE
jgi:hypothetical protein